MIDIDAIRAQVDAETPHVPPTTYRFTSPHEETRARTFSYQKRLEHIAAETARRVLAIRRAVIVDAIGEPATAALLAIIEAK